MKTKIKNLVFTIILVLFTKIIMSNEVKVVLTEVENEFKFENWMISNWDLNVDDVLSIEPWMMNRRLWETDTINHNKHFNKYGEKYEMSMRGHHSQLSLFHALNEQVLVASFIKVLLTII
jgi:hypothetical protein